MKKIISSLLLVITAAFMLAMGNVTINAEENEETLIELYPGNNPEFRDQYGDSNWVVDFLGHRWFNTNRAVTFVSKFTGYDPDAETPKTEYVEGDVPQVQYPSGSGGVIVNDTDEDIIIKVADQANSTRQSLASTVTSRFWAYFDKDGKLMMYEDEFINARFLTRVTGQEYWRFSTETEITQYNDAPEGEKPENIIQSTYRIKVADNDLGYVAEPVTLGWNVVAGDETDTQKSSVVSHDSRDVAIPAGWTVVRFGEMARNKPVIDWTATFADVVVENSDEKMVFHYLDPVVKFVGIDELDQNPSVDDVVLIFGYNSEPSIASLITGVSARYIDEEDDIKSGGTGTSYKNADYFIDIFDGEELLETIEVKYNAETSKYVADELTKIDTSLFGKEYKLVYRSTSPNNSAVITKDVILSVGVLLPVINGIENKFIDAGQYIDLYEGLTAHDLENDRDITDSIVITHDTSFNPNNVLFGRHTINVKASWTYVEYASKSFKFPISVDEDQKVFQFNVEENEDETLINFNFHTPSTASRIPTAYDFSMVDKVATASVAGHAGGWGRVTSIFDKEGVLITQLDRFTNTTPEVLKADGTVELMKADDYDFVNWVKTYLTEDALLILTHGAATSGEYRAMEVGEQLVEFDFEDFVVEVPVEETFVVNVADVTPPKVVVRTKTFTIETDNTFANAEEAVLSNIVVIEENSYTTSIPGIQRVDITKPGEHEISVIVADEGGNTVEVEFKLVVRDARASETELDDKTTELGEANDKIGDLENQIADLEEALDAKKEGTSLVVTIVVAVVAAGLAFGGAFLLGRKTP